MINHAPEVPASRDDLERTRRDVEAFALVQHDEDGDRLPHNWITHPGLVQQVRKEFGLEAHIPSGVNCDPTQTLLVRTSNGHCFTYELGEVRANNAGYIIMSDGHLRASPSLAPVLAAAYNLSNYDSSHNALRRKDSTAYSMPAPASTPSPNDDAQAVTLYCYQDNPGANWNEKYARAHAVAAHTESLELKGLNSLIDGLKALKGDNKVVKVLVVAAHGGPASMRIDAKDLPFDGPSRVGFFKNQIQPEMFAKAVSPYLVKGASIVLLTCSTAQQGEGAQRDGLLMIQELADRVASVGAADQPVAISGATASTTGNWWMAAASSEAPSIEVKAPAGTVPPAVGR